MSEPVSKPRDADPRTSTSLPTARRWRLSGEWILTILAVVSLFGALGSAELWGKREQRAAAEALDTIEKGHWVVAYIQGRPRLEKPPLPRWITAGLIVATGQIKEWVVRLPNVVSALGMIALTYWLGRGIGGRRLGLASGFILVSILFFAIEMRQAGNDGMLSLCATVALYAGWRRLHAQSPSSEQPQPGLGDRRWGLLMWIALGFGFLCKGPIILLLTILALAPYLAVTGRLKSDWGALVHPWGIAAFTAMALSWPLMVLLRIPEAWEIWYLEMAMKAGSAGVGNETKSREILATQWPLMTGPWVIPATAALALPFLKRGRSLGWGPGLWFPWMWAAVNLAMFCCWRVAKSNYFLPCLPAAAILAGAEWLKVAEEARDRKRLAAISLHGHWILFALLALTGPFIALWLAPEHLVPVCAIAVAMLAAVGGSVWAWRRRADVASLGALASGFVALIVIAYAAIVPKHNDERSHRELARALDRLLPPDETTVTFFHELDEGLWFYLRDRNLVPVPGSQPTYNDAYDMLAKHRGHQHDLTAADRKAIERQRLDETKRLLLDWVAGRGDPGAARDSEYLLIRDKELELFLRDKRFLKQFQELTTEVYRELKLSRSEVVVVRLRRPAAMAAVPAPGANSKRE